MGTIEDILEWSTSKLSPWREDALRRLASGAAMGAQDHDGLLSLIKESAGFSISPKPAAPIALAKAHLSAVAAGASLQIKADLFINFDDERAAVGLEILAELARKTQVLFFTHHNHLTKIAERTLSPGDFSLSRLA